MSAFLPVVAGVLLSLGAFAEIAVLVFPLVAIASGSFALITMLTEDQ